MVNILNLKTSTFTTSVGFPPFTDHPGESAFNFGILNALEQIVQHPSRIPNRIIDTLNIHDPFLTFVCTVSLSS